MNGLINKWIEFGQKNSIIAENDKEFIRYGIYQLIDYIIFFICQLIIFAVFKCLVEGAVFVIAFAVHRKFAGGYHSDTRLRCFIFSNAVSVLFSVIYRADMPNFIIMTALALSVLTIILLVPVECENKRLSADERIKYRRISFVVTAVELIIGFCCMYFRFFAFYALFYGIIFSAVLLIVGYLKLKLKN